MLDVAPSRQTTALLESFRPRAHVRMDFDPAADARAVDVRASITAAPFPDDTFDLIVCYHVLEHVPDDAAAMRELGRILHPGGIAFVQVPWRADRMTDEDPAASPDDRVRRFGQADHVRYYGGDFEQRLAEHGLGFARCAPQDVLSPALIHRFRLWPAESVWIVRPRPIAQGGHGFDASVLAHATLVAVADRAVWDEGDGERLKDLADFVLAAHEQLRNEERRTFVLRADLAAARADSARWRGAYQRLRARPAVRLLAGIARAGRRLRR